MGDVPGPGIVPPSLHPTRRSLLSPRETRDVPRVQPHNRAQPRPTRLRALLCSRPDQAQEECQYTAPPHFAAKSLSPLIAIHYNSPHLPHKRRFRVRLSSPLTRDAARRNRFQRDHVRRHSVAKKRAIATKLTTTAAVLPRWLVLDLKKFGVSRLRRWGLVRSPCGGCGGRIDARCQDRTAFRRCFGGVRSPRRSKARGGTIGPSSSRRNCQRQR